MEPLFYDTRQFNVLGRILRSRSINNTLEWLRSYNNTTFSLYFDVFVSKKKKATIIVDYYENYMFDIS